ncbi:hypothetical protein TNCV_4648541 [Trichonephila clavipes]|uniref:Uncharacterized protein n=1 Tax=Trichonephila clavipes TaxID=2585209 RepID=A0A8X6STF5_TRICX|nr:hypothetical protein TNCV_4648541 [Trichonephila clavipes]
MQKIDSGDTAAGHGKDPLSVRLALEEIKFLSTNLTSADLSNTKAIGDGPRNSEPRYGDEDDTDAGIPSPFLTTTPHQREDIESTYLTCTSALSSRRVKD